MQSSMKAQTTQAVVNLWLDIPRNRTIVKPTLHTATLVLTVYVHITLLDSEDSGVYSSGNFMH